MTRFEAFVERATAASTWSHLENGRGRGINGLDMQVFGLTSLLILSAGVFVLGRCV
jgi:hypothetical protein